MIPKIKNGVTIEHNLSSMNTKIDSKTISLDEAYRLIEFASAVVIDNVVTYPSMSQLLAEDDPEAADNEWLYLEWDDSQEGFEYSVKFTQGPNQSPRLEGSSIFLIDHEGEETQITLLAPARITKGEDGQHYIEIPESNKV